MPMPAFTAQSSLYRASRHYLAGGAVVRAKAAGQFVTPAYPCACTDPNCHNPMTTCTCDCRCNAGEVYCPADGSCCPRGQCSSNDGCCQGISHPCPADGSCCPIGSCTGYGCCPRCRGLTGCALARCGCICSGGVPEPHPPAPCGFICT
jgi:hypothetical protein